MLEMTERIHAMGGELDDEALNNEESNRGNI